MVRVEEERRNLIRAHEWIRLFPERKLCGHDGLGVWWDDARDSTHLRVWKDVRSDLKNAWLEKFKDDMKKLTDPGRR